MSKTVTVGLSLAMGLAIGIAGGSRLINPPAKAQTAAAPASFSAVPGAIGEQDISGPYQVQAGWPKDLSTLPGHEKWTYGGARGIFAESPNRVFLLGGGELPAMRRPPVRLLTDVGPNVQFPIAGLPWRNANTASPPGADGTHFNRPTFMAWLPDGSFYVADGYNGTRVAKFDASGKFVLDFGMPGDPGKETRPGYMNNVHGVAVDVQTRRVFVNDRDNNRIQIFDENGKYLSEWRIAVRPSSLHYVVIGEDRKLVTFDRLTHKMLKYELDGRLIYSWGTIGDFPGTLWGVHGMSTDQEGNLYVAEVDSGRFQKFRPRPGANPATLIGKPIYSAWQ